MATPTILQHVASTSNASNGGSVNGFVFALPNSVQAGNCLILAITFCRNPLATVTVSTITDSAGDTWSTTPDSTIAASASTPGSAIFIHPNASAGTHKLTLNFSASVSMFQYTISEVNNIATSTPVDVHAEQQIAASGSPASVSTPSMTTNVAGDLIWSYFACVDSPFATVPTDYSPGSGFTLLDGSIYTSDGVPRATEYQVQGSAGAITSSLTVTGGGTGTWNCLQIALKSASAGAARPAGIYINALVMESANPIQQPTASATQTQIKFPYTGNTLLLFTLDNPGLTDSVTDTAGHTWTKQSTVSGFALWYVKNAVANSSLVITTHGTAYNTGNNNFLFLFDISGADADPVDGYTEVSGTSQTAPTTSSPFDLNDKPDFTPASANGLTIATLLNGLGPTSGLSAAAPSGAVYVFPFDNPGNDGDQLYYGNGAAVLFNSDTSTEAWGWHLPNVASVSSAELYGYSAVHLKGSAPAISPSSFSNRYGPKLHGRPNPTSRFRSTRHPGGFDPNAQEKEHLRTPSFWTSPGTSRLPAANPTSRFVSPLAYSPPAGVSVSLPPPPNFWAAPGAFFPSRRNKFTSPLAFLRGPDPAPPGSASFWRSSGPRRFAKGSPVRRFRSPQTYFVVAPGTTFFQSLAGTLIAAGALIMQPQKVLAGTLTSSGALLKLVGKVLAGTLTSSGALVKLVTHAFAGTLTSSGALIKQIGKVLGGTLTSSGVVSIIKVALRSFAGTLSMSGSLIKQVQKPLGGTLTSAGALLKQTQKFFAGTLTSAGSLLKQIGKVFAGTLTSSGVLTVIKVAIRSFAGTLTMAGTLTRQTSKGLGGSLTSSGTLLRKISKGFAGALTPAGALTKRLAKSFAGTLTLVGAAVVQLLAAVPAVGKALFGKTDQTALQGKADPGSLKGKDDSSSVKGRPD
jgi:hypothetical protein